MSLHDRVANILVQHQIERCSVSTPTDSYQWGRCIAGDFEGEYLPIKGVKWDEVHAEIQASHAADELIRANLVGEAPF